MKITISAGHKLIYTNKKEEIIKQFTNPFFLTNTQNDIPLVLSEIDNIQKTKKLKEFFFIVDSSNKEDLIKIEEIFNKGGGLGLRVGIFAKDEESLKKDVGEDIFTMIKDNVHEIEYI